MLSRPEPNRHELDSVSNCCLRSSITSPFDLRTRPWQEHDRLSIQFVSRWTDCLYRSIVHTVVTCPTVSFSEQSPVFPQTIAYCPRVCSTTSSGIHPRAHVPRVDLTEGVRQASQGPDRKTDLEPGPDMSQDCTRRCSCNMIIDNAFHRGSRRPAKEKGENRGFSLTHPRRMAVSACSIRGYGLTMAL